MLTVGERQDVGERFLVLGTGALVRVNSPSHGIFYLVSHAPFPFLLDVKQEVHEKIPEAIRGLLIL